MQQSHVKCLEWMYLTLHGFVHPEHNFSASGEYSFTQNYIILREGAVMTNSPFMPIKSIA